LIGKILNSAIRQYLKYRYNAIVENDGKEDQLQDQLRLNLLRSAETTIYGLNNSFKDLKTYEDFKSNIPLVKYDDLLPYIERMMKGEENVLWPGRIQYFSKSSGTTKERSKYLPISDTFLRANLISSSWDTTAFIYNNDPESTIFYRKSLIMGGSLHPYSENKNINVGDVSAIMINTIPPIGRPFYAPDFDVALMSNWDEKIEKVVEQCIDEDIVMFGGVPTWNIVLFNKILEKTGKSNMLEIWPNLKYYLHGGVNFKPYEQMFKNYVPSDEFFFIEAYNASEGYFAVQDNFYEDGMRLLLNNGIFYEFIEPKLLDEPDAASKTITIDEVELNKNYAIIITTNSGLWRYVIGDTVTFSHLRPYKLKVTGRVEHYINAFGEEVMVSNTDQALAGAMEKWGVHVNEYTIAPYIPNSSDKGRHEWLIEFDKHPADLNHFADTIDEILRAINSDYDAKRYKDMAMEPLSIIPVEKGTFHKWMRAKNKLGGQNKVPRLQNDRTLFNEILQIQQLQNGGY
jgi:hypothetical protein